MADGPKPDQRQYHSTTSAYSLPNDGIEQNRLEIQAQALEQLMRNIIFHAPLVKPKRILDIGCGTGRSTVQLAQRFPDARIIGVDLSPVPAVRPKPDNVEYIQADIRQLVKSDDERFANGSFDYVFSRLLSLGMTDWEGYVSEVSSILAPGGWFEVQEFEIGHHDANGTVITDEIPAMKANACTRNIARKGMEPLIALKAGGLMQDCGFTEVEEKPYKIPLVEQPDSPELAMISKLVSKLAISLRSIWFKLGTGVYSQEELERLSQELIDAYAKFKPGTHLHFIVVTGRKEV